jgi:NAD(P)-dependent dehydrogenase (short-subunit alcohol dehydrogenase family)
MDTDTAATTPSTPPAPVALVTGGSKGLGFALVSALVDRGWRVVLDGRDPGRLASSVDALPRGHFATAVPGDVADPAHRARLVEAAAAAGGLDLLVHNASTLGPVPLPALAGYPLEALEAVFAVNAFAPLALTQAALPLLRARRGRVVSVSSDAAVEAYEGWGGYGAAKAALDQLTAVLAAELPELSIYSFDPGDMRTDLARLAFSDDEFAERPEPVTVVPALLRLLDDGLPSGRYAATDLRVPAGGPA